MSSGATSTSATVVTATATATATAVTAAAAATATAVTAAAATATGQVATAAATPTRTWRCACSWCASDKTARRGPPKRAKQPQEEFVYNSLSGSTQTVQVPPQEYTCVRILDDHAIDEVLDSFRAR
eukprot:4799579-Pleurochrysis_carterae.AAC.2